MDQKRLNIPYIDGLRGLLALWVVLGHARYEIQDSMVGHSAFIQWMTHFHEEAAVPAFIVISGFLLTLPLRNRESRERWNSIQFLKRRCMRILPIYYTLLVILFVIVRWQYVEHIPVTPRWFPAIPTEWPATLLSHVFLVHYWLPFANPSFDPPMWSLSVEWQLYMLLPLLIVPLYRRTGAKFPLLCSVAICLLLLAVDRSFAFLSLGFILGWVAMECCLGDQWHLKLSPQVCHGGAWLSAIGVLASMATLKGIPQHIGLLLFFPSLLVCLVLGQEHSSPPAFAALLNSKMCQALGWMSYSLYLVHFPILSLMNWILMLFHISDGVRIIGVVIGGPLISLVAAAILAGTVEHRNWLKKTKPLPT